MADLTLDPRVGISGFDIADWSPGQSLLTGPYRPANYPTGPVATSWRGTIRLAPKKADADRDFKAADRALLALVAQLRGAYHRLKVPLPSQFQADGVPATATTSLASAALDGETVRVIVHAANWGAWTPVVGDWCNIGDQLYHVVGVSGTTLNLTPPVIPLAISKPRGIQPLGGPAGWSVRGLGIWRGSLYLGLTQSAEGRVFWFDPKTGTAREVLDTQTAVRSLGAAFDRFYFARGAGGLGASRIERINVDLADPDDNSAYEVLRFTDLTGMPNDRLLGMAEWQGPADSGPKLYALRRTALYRSKRPVPDVPAETTFLDFFELISPGPTGLTDGRGLSAGPDGLLYILDRGANDVKTWDGLETNVWASGGLVTTETANTVRFRDCDAIEWYQGELYVGNRARGSSGAGVGRVNWRTPEDAAVIEFANPFVMARLQDGPRAGPHGFRFTQTTWGWTEAPTL